MNKVQQRDFYETLKVRRNATPREIERAYRMTVGRLSFQRHEQQSFLENREEVLMQLDEAYETLSNPERREVYDRAIFGLPDSLIDPHPYAGPQSPVTGKNQGRKRHSVYEDFYGFSEKPFDLTPNPKYLYLSPKHKEALAHLVYGLQENNGFLKIVGEVGTGKTMISRCFLNQIHQDFNIAYIFNPCLSSVELLQAINSELGIPSTSESRKILTDILNEYLLKQRKKGNRVVVIIDEAQDLDPQVLEQLRLLSNLETETQKLLQIVLIGQPELDKILNGEDLRQLRQRITIQWELLPLNLEETRGYIQHRLNVALGKGKVNFTHSALELVFRYSQGIPRMINVLADRALLIGYTMNTKKFGAKVIRLAAQDIGNIRLRPGKIQNAWKTALPILILSAVFGFALDKVNIPELSNKHKSENNLRQYIQNNPLDISPPMVPAQKPKAAKIMEPSFSSATEPPVTITSEPKAPETLAPIDKNEPGRLEISSNDKLVTYLSSLSLSESRAEAIKWILNRWGVVSGNLKGSSEWLLDDIENDYQLIPYELSGNLERLTQLNYPAILEITLPNSLGTKYLALLSIKEGKGFFGSVDRIEMPMKIIGKLWNGKAIVLWRDFESLPFSLTKGFKGKEVVWVQKNLRLLGFFKGKESPNYGPKTQQAVTLFQRRHGIKDDGNFNSETRMTAYRLLNIYHTPKLTDG
tara:strand:- start:975 stop:3065 length:2091 start_codon:yes stop_codon:yes gene_type:complete